MQVPTELSSSPKLQNILSGTTYRHHINYLIIKRLAYGYRDSPEKPPRLAPGGFSHATRSVQDGTGTHDFDRHVAVFRPAIDASIVGDWLGLPFALGI